METKLRIKIGEVEIDYTGDRSFIKDELPELLKTLQNITPPTSQGNTHTPQKKQGEKPHGESSVTAKTIFLREKKKNIAALISAAAYELSQTKSRFSRDELTKTMRDTDSFTKGMQKNFKSSLKSAITRGVLSEIATNTYSLSESEKERIRNLSAQG